MGGRKGRMPENLSEIIWKIWSRMCRRGLPHMWPSRKRALVSQSSGKEEWWHLGLRVTAVWTLHYSCDDSKERKWAGQHKSQKLSSRDLYKEPWPAAAVHLRQDGGGMLSQKLSGMQWPAGGGEPFRATHTQAPMECYYAASISALCISLCTCIICSLLSLRRTKASHDQQLSPRAPDFGHQFLPPAWMNRTRPMLNRIYNLTLASHSPLSMTSRPWVTHGQ